MRAGIGLLLAVLPALARTQGSADRLVGVYDTDTGSPLADVQVVLVGTQLAWRTTSSGLVLLRGVPAGDHVLRLRRIGYEPVTLFTAFSPADTVPLTLVMKVAPVLLPEVLVTAREERFERKLRGFVQRRRAGNAPASSFITAADLERWSATRWPDALARSIGVRSDVSGRIRIRGCANFALFLDGVLLSDSNLDAIPLQQVAAIEVYRGGADMPAEFNVTARRCSAAVVVWTR